MRYFQNIHTIEDLKEQYKQLVKKYHPDVNPDKDTTEDMKQINDEYKRLHKKKLMQAYKEKLEEIEYRNQTEEVRASHQFSYIEEECEMETLYWSNSQKCYASARYTIHNR